MQTSESSADGPELVCPLQQQTLHQRQTFRDVLGNHETFDAGSEENEDNREGQDEGHHAKAGEIGYPLMVRPSAPRFLNFGDEFELPVVLQNQTSYDSTIDRYIAVSPGSRPSRPPI